MPWDKSDVDRFKKGLSDKQKRKWKHVANSQKRRGQDDASAIKSANAVTKGSIDRRLNRNKKGGNK